MEFITGTSSGLGQGLAELALSQGGLVAGMSRRPSTLSRKYPESYFHMECDLGDLKELPGVIRRYFHSLREWLGSRASNQPDGPRAAPDSSGKIALERVWLNAGILGRIDDLQNTTLTELKAITDINLWANKILIDSLASPDCPFGVKHIVAISSGASVNGSRGWAGYSISKAALNMLIKLYSEELQDIHLISLAPGLIDTAMQETISSIQDTEIFPALKRLQQARGTENMPEPVEAARRIMEKWPAIANAPSGSFLDIRKM